MANSPSAARSQLVDKPPSRGGTVDGRTLAARRRRELINAYTVALGGIEAISVSRLVDVRRAAELVALAESERAKALRGEAVDLSALIRVEGAADRAVRRLGIKPGAVPSRPLTLAEYAKAKAAGKATGSAGDAPA